jgi:hypothetical protein
VTRRGFLAPKVTGPRRGRLPALRLVWRPLIVDRTWNEEARKLAHEASGVYVVRDKRTGTVLYVGESHTGRMWKTLLRHFQDPSGKFRRVSEWTHGNPGACEVAIVVTARGQAALDLQAQAIEKLQPTRNRDDGKAAGPIVTEAQDEDFFAQFSRENPGRGAVMRVREPNPTIARKASADRPKGALVTLGALTELEFRARGGTLSVWRWSLRSAPVLAYDTRGRLFIVYGARPSGRASAAARREYERTHWGLPGAGDELAGTLIAGSAPTVGVSTRITYTTRKGDDPALVDYVHRWGEGASGVWEAPVIVCQGERVALAGGTYKVNDRGIVG